MNLLLDAFFAVLFFTIVSLVAGVHNVFYDGGIPMSAILLWLAIWRAMEKKPVSMKGETTQ